MERAGPESASENPEPRRRVRAATPNCWEGLGEETQRNICIAKEEQCALCHFQPLVLSSEKLLSTKQTKGREAQVATNVVVVVDGGWGPCRQPESTFLIQCSPHTSCSFRDNRSLQPSGWTGQARWTTRE